MKIIVNGEHREISDGSTAEDLIAEMELAGKRIAVEVNQEILPRSQFHSYTLKANDTIEIVHAIGGG